MLARALVNRGVAFPLLLTLGVLLVACGSDSSDETSASEEVKIRLLSAAELKPVTESRSFSWDNPIDYVAQGLPLPEGTPPSEAIETVEDAGFEVAAGQQIASQGVPVGQINVAQFDSADGATEAQGYLHEQDMLSPCFRACTVNAHPFTIQSIPGSTGVRLTPNGVEIPPGEEPFERVLVRFTVDEFLYSIGVDGDPGSIPMGEFEQGAEQLYQRAKKVH